MKEVKNIVIVGNGLDLHHGIKSNYGSFYNDTSFPNELKTAYDILTDNYPRVVDWFDFEEEYRSLIENETKILENGGYDGRHKGICLENRKYYFPRIKLLNYVFQTINKKFTIYLANEYKNAKINEKFKCDYAVKQVLDASDVVLTFNYTETLKDIYSIDSHKIIHVHGTLEDGAIIGHSNYCNYDKATGVTSNYGLCMSIPEFRESTYLGDKFLQRIEKWNGLKHNSGIFADKQSFGDINARPIESVKLIINKSPFSMNMLEQMYENPFSEFYDSHNGLKFTNQLALDFDKDITITVIGHGLQSDIDLLSKIPTDIRTISVFQREGVHDEGLVGRASEVFNSYDVREILYSFK